jgi:hypothetical protein
MLPDLGCRLEFLEEERKNVLKLWSCGMLTSKPTRGAMRGSWSLIVGVVLKMSGGLDVYSRVYGCHSRRCDVGEGWSLCPNIVVLPVVLGVLCEAAYATKYRPPYSCPPSLVRPGTSQISITWSKRCFCLRRRGSMHDVAGENPWRRE